MKILFRGVGSASHIHQDLDHPVCPQVGEEVCFSDDGDSDTWHVRTIVHMPHAKDYDVYCLVGDPR